MEVLWQQVMPEELENASRRQRALWQSEIPQALRVDKAGAAAKQKAKLCMWSKQPQVFPAWNSRHAAGDQVRSLQADLQGLRRWKPCSSSNLVPQEAGLQQR